MSDEAEIARLKAEVAAAAACAPQVTTEAEVVEPATWLCRNCGEDFTTDDPGALASFITVHGCFDGARRLRSV